MEYKLFNSKALEEFYVEQKSQIINDADICKFFDNFTFEETKQKIKLSEVNKDNKTTVIQLLNKLNDRNFNKTVGQLRTLEFDTIEELDYFVYQTIQKIKKEHGSLKILFSRLCWEIQQINYVINQTKFVFRKLFLDKIKQEYEATINFDSWDKKNAELSMNLIGILYSHKLITNEILDIVIKSLKTNVEYRENMNYDICDKSLFLLMHLIQNIDDYSHIMFTKLETFLKEQLAIYKDDVKTSHMLHIPIQHIIELIEK